MKKRNLLLAFVAGFALSSCTIQDLMFWKKKDDQQQQQDDDSKTDPVVSEWAANVQNLMKQYLDGVVLPYVSGTWTWEYDSEYKCVYGTSYDAKVSEAKAAFSGWEQLGEDDYGDMWYGKSTTNGSIELCPYEGKDNSNKSMAVIEAYFKQVQPDWTDADKAVMRNFLGFEVPFVTGYWSDGLAYNSESDSIYCEGENVNLEEAQANLEAGGYFVTEQSFWGIPIGLLATKIVGDIKVKVDLQDWSIFGDGCSIEISKLDKVTDWPTDDVATAAGVYMDYEPEIVPEPVGATGYFVSEGEDGLLVDAVGVTTSAYLELLNGESWTVIDTYVQEYGFYVCYSPNETVILYITSGLSYLELEIVASVPRLDSWPTSYIDTFTFTNLGSIYKVLEFEGQYYYYNQGTVEDTTYGSYDQAVIEIEKESPSEADLVAYKEALAADGYEVSYQAETSSAYATLVATKGKIQITGKYYSTEGQEFFRLTIVGVEANESPLVVKNKQIDLLKGYSAQINASLLTGFEGTIVYGSKNPEVATVTSEGEVTAVSKGTAEIEVSVEVFGKTFIDTVTVSVLEQATSVSISGPEVAKKGKSYQYEVAFPEGTTSMDAPVWSLTSGSGFASIDSATGLLTVSDELISEQSATIHLVVGSLSADFTVDLKPVSEVTDTLTISKIFGESKPTSYTDFSNVSDASDAKYAGRCCTNNSGDFIQINKKTPPLGIYSSTSGGTIRSVTVNFHSSDANSNEVNVYASNEPFTLAEVSSKATLVGTITNSGGTGTYEFTSDYAYVAIMTAKNAHYFSSVSFVWEA